MKNYNIFYAKEKAKTIADKDEKLQVDTNSSVPESVPVDGEVKEPKDAKEGNETKKEGEEKPLDNNDTISELQKQILENGLEGLEETAAGGNAGGAEGGVSLSAAAFEQGGHESNIRETFREVDPYGHPVDLNGLMGADGISGNTTPPRDTTPPNEPKIEIDHPNGKVIITPDPLTTEGGDTTTINYTDDNGNSKSATYTKGSDGEWHLIDKDNYPHMPESSESGKITIPDEAVKDNTEIISFSTDKVGNKSSEAKDIAPDITPPEVTIDKITLCDTDVRANDSVEKIRVTGHSDEKDGILKIYDKDDNLIHTGNTDSNGNFDVEIVTDKVAKFENVTARVTDKSNNTGSDTKDSGGYIEHSDKTAPKVSDIETFSTDKSTPADGVSDETRITFKVDDPTVTAKVVIEGHEYDANNNNDGTWSVTVPGFKEGTIVDVIATDGAGNKGSASAKVGGIDHFDDVTPPNDPAISATNDGGAIVTPTSDYRVGDKVIVSFSDEQGNSVVREYTKGSNNEWSDNSGHSSVGGVIKINEDEIKDFSTISAKGKDIAGNFSNEVTAVVSQDPIPDMSTTIITQTTDRVSEGEVATYKIELPRSIRHDASFEFNIEHITTADEDLGKPRFTNGVRLSDDGTRVIVPAGVKSWTMKYDTFDDHLSERDESFSFKIHTATARGTIVDNDAITHADIVGYDHINGDVANGSDGIAMEGKTLTYDITLGGIDVDNRNYNVNFNYANGANIYDINSISCETEGSAKVTFTRTSNTSGYFTVPAGVNNFKMLIKTTNDSTYEEDEVIKFRILDANATATIVNDDPIPDAYIYTLQTAAVTEGQDLVYTAKTSFTTLKEQRFAYKLSLNGETNKDTDNPDMVVEPKFSNGVYLDKAANEIVVPKGTSEFTVTYKTIADGIIEVPNSDKVALTLGRVSAEATILNKDIPTADGVGGVGYENPTDETRGAIVYDKVTNRFSVDSTATASNEITYKFTLHGNFGAGVEDTLYFYAKNVRISSNTGNTWEGGLELEKYPLSFSKDGGQTWSKHTITGTWKDGDEVLVKVALRDSTPNELWRNPTDRLLNEGEAHPDVADQTYHGSEYARNGWLKEIPGRLTFSRLGYSVETVGYKVDNDDMVYIAEKSDEAVNIDTKSGNDSIRISADLPNKDNHINSGDADDKIYVQGINPDGSNIKLAGTIDGGLGRDSFSNDLYSKVELTDNLDLIGFTSAGLYVTDTTDKVVHFTQNEANGEGHYTVGGKILGQDSKVIIDNNSNSYYYMDFAKASEISHIEANGGSNSVRLFGETKVGDITINSNNGGEFYTYAPNNRISGDINLTEDSSRRYNFNMNGKNAVNGDINLNFAKEELDPNINWHWDVKYFTESYAKNIVIKGVNDSQKTDLHDVSITSGKNSMLAMDFNYLNIDGNLDVNSHGRNNFTFYNTVVTGDLNVASGDTDLAYAMYRGTSSANQNKYNWYNVTIKGDANVAMDGHSNYFNLERVSTERGLNATANNSSTDSFVVRNSKIDNSHISNFEYLSLDTKVDNLTADGLNTLNLYARGENAVTNSTFKGSSAKTDHLTIDGHSLSNSHFEGFENVTIYNATVDGTTTISNPDENGTESKMFYTLSGATLRDFALKNSGEYIYAYGTNNFENVAHLEDHTFYLADRSVINVNSQDSNSGTFKFSADNNVTIKADDTLKELESVGALRISMEGFATTYINARETNIDSFHYNLDLTKGHNTWNRFGEVAYTSSLTLHDKHDVKLYGQGTDRYETINLYGNTTYVGDGNKATVDLDMKGGIDVIYVSDSVKVKDMNISMDAGNDSFVFYNKNASVVGSIIDGGLGEDGLSITGGSTSIGNEFKNFNSISIGKDARVEDTNFIADSEYRATTVSIDSDHGFKNTTFVAGEGKEFNFTLSDYTKPSRTYDFAEDGGMFDHTGKANLNFNYGTTEIKNLHDDADKETNITFTAHNNTDKVVNSNFESLTLTDYNNKIGKVSVEGSTIKTVRGSDLADTLTLDEHSDITKSVSLGKGNDTITIKGNVDSATLDGGEGFDTLVVSKDLAWNKVSNFETLVLGEDNDHSSITLSADNVEGILKNSIINSYWSGESKYNQINIVGDSTDHVTLKGYKLAENPSYAYNAKPADMGESTLYESYNQATGVRTFVRVENDVNLDLQ